MATQAARKTSVAARLIQTLTSEMPQELQRKPLTMTMALAMPGVS